MRACVETKASNNALHEFQYTDVSRHQSKLLKRLKILKDSNVGDETFFLPPLILHVLVASFKRRSLFISSQLFVHNFDLRETKVCDLAAGHSQLSDKPVEHLSIARDDHHRAWFRSLAVGLGRILYRKPLSRALWLFQVAGRKG